MVNFTPREFVIPARESRREEELEWLRKREEGRRKKAENGEGINFDDLMEKGVNFFKNGDYVSAVEVFSCGVETYPNSPNFYTNRAAARIKVQQGYLSVMSCCNPIHVVLLLSCYVL